MATFSLFGINFDTANFEGDSGYGYWRTEQAVDGTTYPLLIAAMVAGSLDAQASATAADIVSGAVYTADTSATADADPGAGKMRWNNADQTAATVLYIDLADADGGDRTAEIDAMDGSTSTVKGIVSLINRANAAQWVKYDLTAVTTASGYRKLTVAYRAGPGGIANAASVAVGFIPTGDLGATGATGAAGTVAITRRAITGTDTAIAGDKGNLLDITSGTFTLSFSACATLGDGWAAYIRNSGTGDVTLDPDGAEQIDGLTSWILYPGEARLVQCDGAALRSIMLKPGQRTYTTTEAFVVPPGVSGFEIDCIGGGGGGGSGRRGAAGEVRSGGSGGGGGARVKQPVLPIAPGTSVTATVGAGGNAGPAITSNSSNGDSGSAGGTSSFGTYVIAYGGGAGGGGSQGAQAGGGGGGSGGAGDNSATTDTATNGGLPRQAGAFGSATSGFKDNTSGGGGAGLNPTEGGLAEWGGGAGGSAPSPDAAQGQAAGGALFGAGGGGGGGGLSTANAYTGAGSGGRHGYYSTGNGGAGGSADGASGSAGTSSTTGCGHGGGGGAGSVAGVAGSGGAGGTPGGGGGGGGGSANGQNSGAGGAGGRGEVRVYWW